MANIRENTAGGLNREHFITKQDIHNIKNQYNIERVTRHANDLTSVCAFVEELKELCSRAVSSNLYIGIVWCALICILVPVLIFLINYTMCKHIHCCYQS